MTLSEIAQVPEWAKRIPKTYERWLRLMHALGLVQQELARPDQQMKLAALVETAFALGREAERELAQSDRAQRALLAIAKHGEALEKMGEPQNNVPQFCRAILRGEDADLDDFTLK